MKRLRLQSGKQQEGEGGRSVLEPRRILHYLPTLLWRALAKDHSSEFVKCYNKENIHTFKSVFIICKALVSLISMEIELNHWPPVELGKPLSASTQSSRAMHLLFATVVESLHGGRGIPEGKQDMQAACHSTLRFTQGGGRILTSQQLSYWNCLWEGLRKHFPLTGDVISGFPCEWIQSMVMS